MFTKDELFPKFVGEIKCIEITDLENGDCKVIFEYNEEFKRGYREAFGLKKFSKKHFQKTLDKAIKSFAEQIEKEKALLDSKEE